ncbi:unnamed protein product [Cylicocyclus nassatus]|uniref:Uncharacterized protein n=1 Tax=Cylicocyclus nassatus TaxID=53992 RepID=A0AA36GCP0_CYLNA|nr:unnamed protein product [Cylicocyclus nassatus]
MRFLHIVALTIVFCSFADALKIKKSKKEPTYIQVPPEVEGGSPRYVKAPKVLTEYDKCKMECRRQRDAVNRKDNIAALREQLAALEAEEAAAAKAAEGSVPGEQPDNLQAKDVHILLNREA